MAIDTANKRRSAGNRRYIRHSFPVPDGAIEGADRIGQAGLYDGIALLPPLLIPIIEFILTADINATMASLEALINATEKGLLAERLASETEELAVA